MKWFKPIVPLEFDGKTLRLCVPNMSYVYQIEKHYIPFLRPIISQLYGQGDPPALRRSQKRRTERASVERSRYDGDFAVQHPDQHGKYKKSVRFPGAQEDQHRPPAESELTFATFIEGRVQPARTLGRHVRRGRSGQYAFQSAYIFTEIRGWEKRISRSRSAMRSAQRHPELQVLYVSMNKFQAQFQTAYKNGEIPDFIHFYQMIDVLIIDDIQELTGKTGPRTPSSTYSTTCSWPENSSS